jgi:DNA polymerase III delta prime subunit
MSQFNKITHIYNPANQSYEELLENFVIRKKEFKKIIREFQDVDFKTSVQHFLVEGQRGTGKTSLLLRVRYEIENNPEYSNLLAVQFAEEQYNIFDLCRLWESTAEKLEEVEGFESLSDEMENMSEEDSYIVECFTLLDKKLKREKKRLVLLLDNFGDILDKLSDTEQQRLRDIFHSSNHIQLIASSSRVLEHTYKHDKPFFEFFKIIKLDGLNKDDTNLLLRQLALSLGKKDEIEEIIKTQGSRIETIRRLTGGVPRTIVLLFEIFLDNSANVFEDLEMILDRVTPLYKHRMDDLPTQQQAIMDTMALNWDGITSKEIVNGLSKRGFDTKKVSSQLNILVKNNLVLSKNIDKKNKIYFVKERFFNIWYLMRYGRKKNKSQVLWLVRFLEEWCSKEELESKAKEHIKCAKEGTLHSTGGVFMAEALSGLIKDYELQHELLFETKNALRKSDSNIDKNLSNSDIELYKKYREMLEKEENKEALRFLMQIQHKDAEIYYRIGHLYMKLNEYSLVIDFATHAMNQGHEYASLMLSLVYYIENIEKNKSYEQIKKFIGNKIEKNDFENMGISLVLLWNDEFSQSIKYIKNLIKVNYINNQKHIGDEYLILLLAKKQYHPAYKLYQEFPQLKEQFKLIYYVVMRHLKEEYPKEHLKMGSELEETVLEIEEKILRERELRA